MATPKYLRQVYHMSKKNLILMIRYWKSLVSQTVVAPIIVLLLLYGLQSSINNLFDGSIINPPVEQMPGVSSCFTGYRSPNPCISLLYSPVGDSLFDDIMQRFVILNNQRQSVPWSIDNSKWSPNLQQLPSNSLSVVGVPDPNFIYNFTDKFPNVTAWGVSFSLDLTSIPGKKNIQYQIWYNVSETVRKFRVSGAPAFVTPFLEPYNDQIVYLMRQIDEAILISTSSSKTNDPRLQYSVKGMPSYSTNTANSCPRNPDATFNNIGPLFLFIPLIFVFFSTLNTIVNEKEKHLKEAMEMIGLNPSVYWISYFITTTIPVFIASLVTTAFGVWFGFSFFKNTNFGVALFLFIMLGWASQALAIFIASLTSRVRTAIGVGFFYVIIAVIFLGTSQISTYVWYSAPNATTDLNPGWKILILFPFYNFDMVLNDIFQTTSQRLVRNGTKCILQAGDYFGWDQMPNQLVLNQGNLFGVDPKDVPPASTNMLLLFMNICMFLILAVYLDQVIPNENGYSEHPLFFLFPSYYGYQDPKWLKRSTVQAPVKDVYNIPANEDPDVVAERKEATDYSGSETDTAGLRIMKLHKQYDAGIYQIAGWVLRAFGWRGTLGGGKPAVHELSLVLPKGQMLALLGSNGAGKTSTMKVLYGISPPTFGDAFIFGMNMRTHMREIKKELGVCPQFDLLFSDMTALEHVNLFCGIKGIPEEEMMKVSEQRLKHMKLWEVRNQMAGEYSGGMKRRLSVILSTLGNPKCVFLDEPTTGMDPVNRRYVWSFLEEFKKDRVIVLTTHSMEEADILADKIAIMSKGRLKAVGKSLHLKNKYGTGYRISLNIKESKFVPIVKEKLREVCSYARLDEEEIIGGADAAPDVNAPAVNEINLIEVKKTALLVYVLTDMTSVKAIIGYLESLKRQSLSQLKQQELDDKENVAQNTSAEKENVENIRDMISSFGLSQTTLEDVFLKTVKQEQVTSPKPQ